VIFFSRNVLSITRCMHGISRSSGYVEQRERKERTKEKLATDLITSSTHLVSPTRLVLLTLSSLTKRTHPSGLIKSSISQRFFSAHESALLSPLNPQSQASFVRQQASKRCPVLSHIRMASCMHACSQTPVILMTVLMGRRMGRRRNQNCDMWRSMCWAWLGYGT
jgi:hypothetical protein